MTRGVAPQHPAIGPHSITCAQKATLFSMSLHITAFGHFLCAQQAGYGAAAAGYQRPAVPQQAGYPAQRVQQQGMGMGYGAAAQAYRTPGGYGAQTAAYAAQPAPTGYGAPVAPTGYGVPAQTVRRLR